MLNHNGYYGRVEFDDDAGLFHGEVLGIRDVVTFEGHSVDELRTAFQESVDDYLAYCKQRGEQPDKPCSGRFVLRLSPELHRQVNLHAAAESKSLNVWITDCIHTSIQAVDSP